jgi:hypothetical protein
MLTTSTGAPASGGWFLGRLAVLARRWPRPHRALLQNPPAGRTQPPAETTGMRFLRRDRVGGVIHEYAPGRIG